MAHHAARGSKAAEQAAAQSTAPPASALEVTVRRREGATVLEVSAATGGALGHFDPATGRLHVVDGQHSLAVAAAVGPYLFGTDQPLGQRSPRHLAAADRLWEILEASPFTWQRFVPLRDRLLFFYCPLVRLALEMVDDGPLAEDVPSAALAPLGITLAVVSLRDLEHYPAAVAGGLNALCTRLADSRPGARLDTDQSRSIWRRLKRR
jgi:hypothetical protein